MTGGAISPPAAAWPSNCYVCHPYTRTAANLASTGQLYGTLIRFGVVWAPMRGSEEHSPRDPAQPSSRQRQTSYILSEPTGMMVEIACL